MSDTLSDKEVIAFDRLSENEIELQEKGFIKVFSIYLGTNFDLEKESLEISTIKDKRLDDDMLLLFLENAINDVKSRMEKK